MVFPFQIVVADGAGVVAGVGGRVRAAVAVEQVHKLGAVGGAVAAGGGDRLLDRQIDRMARHLERGERPRV